MVRAAVKIPVGDCMCWAGTRSPRQVFEPRQTAKKWMLVAGVADETAQDGRPKPVGAGTSGQSTPAKPLVNSLLPQTGSQSIEIPLRLNGHHHLAQLDITSR